MLIVGSVFQSRIVLNIVFLLGWNSETLCICIAVWDHVIIWYIYIIYTMVTFVSQYVATEFARSDFISTCVTAVDKVGKGKGGTQRQQGTLGNEWSNALAAFEARVVRIPGGPVALPHPPGHISSLALFKLDLISRSHGRYRACLVCNAAYHHSPSRPALCSIENHHEWAYVQSNSLVHGISFHSMFLLTKNPSIWVGSRPNPSAAASPQPSRDGLRCCAKHQTGCLQVTSSFQWWVNGEQPAEQTSKSRIFHPWKNPSKPNDKFMCVSLFWGFITPVLFRENPQTNMYTHII